MVTSNLPFAFFDQPDFHSLLKLLREDITLPSAKKMRISLEIQSREIQETIKSRIPENRKISIALDAWTSPNRISFVAILAYWMDDKLDLQKYLIGFEQLIEHHTGRYIAKVVSEVIEAYDLKHRLYAVTTDSAGNNRTMADSLTQRFGDVETEILPDASDEEEDALLESLKEAAIRISPVWDKNQLHLPCFAHVIQLTVNSFINGIKGTASDSHDAVPPNVKELEKFKTMPPSFHRTLSMVSCPTCGVTLYLIRQKCF